MSSCLGPMAAAAVSPLGTDAEDASYQGSRNKSTSWLKSGVQYTASVVAGFA